MSNCDQTWAIWAANMRRAEGVTMNAFVPAVLIGVALFAVAIWVEVRERRSAPGDGNYRSSGPPRS
jgi:hypothetical protein